MMDMKPQVLPSSLAAFLWQMIKPLKFWFFCILILPCAWAIDQIIFPYCTKLIIDAIANFSGDKSTIFTHLAPALYLGLGAWIFLILVWRFLDIVYVNFIPRLQANIRLTMFEYVENHSHQFFSNDFSGSIANKISDIANGSWDILNFLCRQLIPTTVIIISSVIIMASVSLKFSLIFLLFFISHMIISIFMSRECDLLSHIHSETKSTLQGKIVDSLSNIINVRLFARNRYEVDYLKRYQNIEIVAQKRLLWSFFKVRLVLEMPSMAMIIFIVYYLIKGWQEGVVSAGDFAFILILSFNIMMSVWQLGLELPNFFKEIGTAKQALDLIRAQHDITDVKGARDLKVKEGRIIFDHVHFHYTTTQDLFKNKNIVIEPGEKIGLVGYSGSGKSTFVNLILRYFDVQSGKILIDGQNIAEVTQDSLRSAIAMIPQDVSLFHRSLMDNIRFGNLLASDEEVIIASQKAHCHEFIKQLPEGYQNLVGERGVKLSGGQRQRIAIARAILKNAPIIILDEATSALDSMTEKLIQESLLQLMQGRTTIVIAHRLSTLLGMDRILVFHEGAIIEEGSHQGLLKQNGHYAKLWHMQAGGFLPDKPV